MQLTIKKIALIKENLEETQGTHNSYADNLKRYLEFEFGGYVLLKVCLLCCNEIWEKGKKIKSFVYKNIRNIRKVGVLMY